ncbi:hypothetical protein [Pseudaminobacter salicylatoxidans]|uniref:hypothetical protein n=1 Tax=Pseudaminobacter salicylatoxidans TaxID=93369 RepID=UPI000D6BF938|nr:hypothetical protein [Pseudaminobacter salicylatoxidans]
MLQSAPDDGGLTIFDDCDVVCEHIASAEIGRLFAAAPDMLAALKLAADTLTPPRNSEESATLEIVRAAIAKAEGRA